MIIINNRPYALCYNLIHIGLNIKVIWYSKHNTLIIKRGSYTFIVYKNGSLLGTIDYRYIKVEQRDQLKSWNEPSIWDNWRICGHYVYNNYDHGIPYYYDNRLNIVSIYGFKMTQYAYMSPPGGMLNASLLDRLYQI